MRYRWKDDPWWNESPGRPFRLAALGAAVGLPALLFAALIRNAVVHPTTPANPIDATVRRMTTDPDRDVRREAMRELWQRDERHRVLTALNFRSPDVQADAVDFLVERGADAVTETMAMLHDPRSRSTATGILLRIGPDALDRVITELPQSSGDAAVVFVGVLGAFGPSSADRTVPALLQAVRGGETATRVAAIDQLDRLGVAAHAVIPDLIAALNDSDAGVRIGAMQTLGGFGRAAESATPAIAKSLGDPAVTNAVAAALGKIGGRAVEPLAAGLDNPAPEVRLASARALEAMGPAAASVVPRLTQLASDDADLKVRRAAAIALSAVTPPAATAKP